MDGTTWAIIAIVVFIIIAVMVSSTKRNQQNVTQTPPAQVIEPLQGGGSTSSQFSPPMSEPRMRIITRRPPPTSDQGIITTTNIDDPIYIPATIKIYHNQRECRVCKKPINWSSRKSGWARCLSTNLLVHGHCYDFTKRRHVSERNWCTICSGSCKSNQPMLIQGVIDNETI